MSKPTTRLDLDEIVEELVQLTLDEMEKIQGRPPSLFLSEGLNLKELLRDLCHYWLTPHKTL